MRKILSIIFLTWCGIIFVSAMILVLPFIFLASLFFKRKKGDDIIFFFLKIWAGIFCALCMFRIRSSISPAYESGKSYIYVCNHSSYLDAVAVVAAIPGSFKPLGKIEMVKIPLFGSIYKRVVVMIDRNSKESRAASVEALKSDLAGGQSILIFPEGTMNRTEQVLTDFYDGAFRLAIETQTPVVPLAIVGAKELLPRDKPSSIRPGRITCVFDSPVEVDGLSAGDLDGLKTHVHNRMYHLLVDAGINISGSSQ